MHKNLKKIISLSLALIFSSFFIVSCEPEADNLGEQFFNAASIRTDSINISGYNISNNDTVRSDLSTLRLGVLGAFDEPVFGMQKASYVSQVRMGSYDPDFGANAVVDSVVLVMNPLIHSDSVTTTTNENFTYAGNIAAKKEVKSYPVAKYGKTKIGGNTNFNIRIHEVTEFLNGPSTKYFSNKSVPLGAEIGSKVFSGKVSSTVITKKDNNEELWKNDVSLRIPLNATFFQNKIIAKQGMQELRDVANFIRYFQGIRISVDEMDGYLFRFDPDNPEIKIYYKYDVVTGSTTTRKQTTFSLPLLGRDSQGGLHNVRIGQYIFDRSGTPVAAIPSTPNSATGDEKLFLQGMGGPSVAIKVPLAVITELQNRFRTDKNAIISAKIRIATDRETWNNSYAKPQSFSLLQEGATNFMSDLALNGSVPNFSFIKNFNLDKNPAYYEITITRTLKEFVETAASAKDLVLIMNMGDFLVSGGAALGYKYTSRPYALERLVLVGNDEGNPDRIKLKVTYSKK